MRKKPRPVKYSTQAGILWRGGGKPSLCYGKRSGTHGQEDSQDKLPTWEKDSLKTSDCSMVHTTQLKSAKENYEERKVAVLATEANPNRSEHILHLYSAKVDKYTLQKPFLFLCDGDEEAIYVTTNSINHMPPEFRSGQVNVEVVGSERFFRLEDRNKRLRIVLDASSLCREARFDANSFNLALRLEEFINKLCEKRPIKCLCTYDVALLDPKMIEQLAKHHHKLLLTTSDITVLSGDSIDGSELSKDSFAEIVKNNLETIVLALLQKRPMCGMEIMEAIHRDFNVFLSPGAVYPLLHTLNSKGLVRFEIIGKTKRYLPADEKAEEEIQNILKEHIHVSKFLSWYLRHTTTPDQEEEVDFLQGTNLRKKRESLE